MPTFENDQLGSKIKSLLRSSLVHMSGVTAAESRNLLGHKKEAASDLPCSRTYIISTKQFFCDRVEPMFSIHCLQVFVLIIRILKAIAR